MSMNGIANQYKKCFMKKTGLKVGCFADFCHHHLHTMSAHSLAYRYRLFESGIKQIHEQLLYVEKMYSTAQLQGNKCSQVQH